MYEPFNEEGAGTFDLLVNDHELGAMAQDQFPLWVLKMINRIVEKSGGRFSLKLDWFAARGRKASPAARPTSGRSPSSTRPSTATSGRPCASSRAREWSKRT